MGVEARCPLCVGTEAEGVEKNAFARAEKGEED